MACLHSAPPNGTAFARSARAPHPPASHHAWRVGRGSFCRLEVKVGRQARPKAPLNMPKKPSDMLASHSRAPGGARAGRAAPSSMLSLRPPWARSDPPTRHGSLTYVPPSCELSFRTNGRSRERSRPSFLQQATCEGLLLLCQKADASRPCLRPESSCGAAKKAVRRLASVRARARESGEWGAALALCVAGASKELSRCSSGVSFLAGSHMNRGL